MTQFICIAAVSNKETVFTHYAHGYDGWIKATAKPDEFEKVVYLGKCALENSDIFAAYSNIGGIGFFKGTKGDEFNNQ